MRTTPYSIEGDKECCSTTLTGASDSSSPRLETDVVRLTAENDASDSSVDGLLHCFSFHRPTAAPIESPTKKVVATNNFGLTYILRYRAHFNAHFIQPTTWPSRRIRLQQMLVCCHNDLPLNRDSLPAQAVQSDLQEPGRRNLDSSAQTRTKSIRPKQQMAPSPNG
jgi:hypothetical protein